jgi:predicted MFS family arabinose efflux permease
LGGALFEPARGALVVKLTRPAERPRFHSVLMMQESVAAVTGALLGTLLLGVDFLWVGLGGCAVFVLAALANAWLLPAYRVATPGTSAGTAMRIPLRDKPFMLLVLTLSGYYIMTVQLMMLVPVTLTELSGAPRTVAWMYPALPAGTPRRALPVAGNPPAHRHWHHVLRRARHVGVARPGAAVRLHRRVLYRFAGGRTGT